MSAPQPPADGHAPGDDAPTPGTADGGNGTGTYDFHGEKLDFDPYRFGRPEPTAPAWSPTAPAAPGSDGGGHPPAPGERWQPGGEAGAPPVQPGDYWGGAGSHRGTFPPAGYVPPAGPPGDDPGRPGVDLGKPDDPPSAPTGWNPPTGSSRSPYAAPTPPPYPAGAQPGQYPGPTGPTTPGRGNGLAIAGFVVSLAALVLFWTYFIASFIGLVGVGLSVGGLVRARRGAAHRGLALWGIVLGVLAVVVGIVITVFVFSRVDMQCLVDLNGDSSRISECVR